MCKKFDLPDGMSNFSPDSVSKVKVLALQPILEQMIDEDAMDNLRNSKNMSYPEYIALTKLITWVKQVTNSALKRQGAVVETVNENDPNKKKKKQTSPFKIRMVKESELEEMKNEAKRSKAARMNKLAPIQNAEKAVKEETGSKSTKSRGGKASKSPESDPLAHPTAKKAIPKVITELASYHQEIVEGKTKNPLLLVLLTTPENISNNTVKDVQSVEESRLAVKIYDTVESHEVLIHVNMREFLLFREDLVQNLHEQVRDYFDPTDLLWWKDHINKIVNVKSRSQSNELKLSISKRAIEELLRHQLEQDDIVIGSNRIIVEQEDGASVSNEMPAHNHRSQQPTPSSSNANKRTKSKAESKKEVTETVKPPSKGTSSGSGSRAASKSEAHKPASGSSKSKHVAPVSKHQAAEKPKSANVPPAPKAASPNVSRKSSGNIEAEVVNVRTVVDEQPSSADETPMYEEEDFEENPVPASKPSTAFTVNTNIEEYSTADEHNYDSAYDTDFEPFSKPVTAAPTPHVNPSQSLSEVDYEEDFDQKSGELKQPSYVPDTEKPREEKIDETEEPDEYQEDFAKLSVVEAKPQETAETENYEDEFDQTKEVKPASNLAEEIAREEENDADYESDFDAVTRAATAVPAQSRQTEQVEPAVSPAPEDTSGYFETSAATLHVSADLEEPKAVGETNAEPMQDEVEYVGIANDDDSLYNMDLNSEVGHEEDPVDKKEKGDDDSLSFIGPDLDEGELEKKGPEVDE